MLPLTKTKIMEYLQKKGDIHNQNNVTPFEVGMEVCEHVLFFSDDSTKTAKEIANKLENKHFTHVTNEQIVAFNDDTPEDFENILNMELNNEDVLLIEEADCLNFTNLTVLSRFIEETKIQVFLTWNKEKITTADVFFRDNTNLYAINQ